jgi:hypothetical protein
MRLRLGMSVSTCRLLFAKERRALAPGSPRIPVAGKRPMYRSASDRSGRVVGYSVVWAEADWFRKKHWLGKGNGDGSAIGPCPRYLALRYPANSAGAGPKPAVGTVTESTQPLAVAVTVGIDS